MAKIPTSLIWKSTGNTIGSGGQSNIEEVVRKNDNEGQFPEKCVMKILKNVGSDQARKRFIHEIEAINSIDDDKIVKILDHHSDDEASFFFYVMPKYEGYEPLSKIIYKKDTSPFYANPTESLKVISECASALDAVHNLQIWHRDIKPDNVLYNQSDKKIIIIDFGCCHIVDNSRVTFIDEGIGTENYRAPECEIGSNDQPSQLSDIYSLGKLLWSLVASERAFARENPVFNGKSMKKYIPI